MHATLCLRKYIKYNIHITRIHNKRNRIKPRVCESFLKVKVINFDTTCSKIDMTNNTFQ